MSIRPWNTLLQYTLLNLKIWFSCLEFFLSSYFFHNVHFLFLSKINWRQMVLNNSLLPITNHTLPFVNLLFMVNIFNIEAGIVLKISDSKFFECKSKWLKITFFSTMWINMTCRITCTCIARKETFDDFILTLWTIGRIIATNLRICIYNSLNCLFLKSSMHSNSRLIIRFLLLFITKSKIL